MADYGNTKPPIDEDIRSEDHEYNPAVEPNKSKAWLNLLLEAEDNFEEWHDHCDNLDKLYANLQELASPRDGKSIRDRKFAMFWANCEVMKPSIYAKPPVPVVTPKFKDRRPVYQAASEIAERCAIVAFDLTRINDVMMLIRDDVAMIGRGVAWCRYESGKEKRSYYDSERVCIDYKDRRDFLHSISRNWREVTWVAAASYLTRSEARDRFQQYSGDAYQEAEYKVDTDSKEVGGADARERAMFWEIWDKPSKRVLWVAHGVEDILDEDDAHLDLQEFFPCPKPAFGTVQRGSLVPVPDVMQYRDQLEEINMLTARIHALSDCLEAKGFYPAGSTELADAIQTAVTTHTSSRMMVPISNWAAFGGTNEVVIWLPIDQIATTIQALVLLRKQIIDDIYQLTGMADIMRGDTDPNETLGAQQLKSQYGTTRIRDKQQELTRLARDLVEITTEIITQKFNKTTIAEMSQTQLPTKQMQEQMIQDVQDQARQQLAQLQQMAPQQGMAPPQGMAPQQGMAPPQQGQQDPQAMVQQVIQQAQNAIQSITNKPNLDQVLTFLKDNRTKSFVLDIETDSTILIDEMAEKQARGEFIGLLSNLLPQLSQMITAEPKTAPFCGEVLKFATAPFRAGRALDGSIDELVELMKDKGEQPQGDDPQTAQGKIALQIEQMKLTYARTKDDADRQVKVAQLQQTGQLGMAKSRTDAQAKAMEVQGRQNENQAKMYQINLEAQNSQREHEMKQQEMVMKQQADAQKANMLAQQHALKQNDMVARQQDRRDQNMLRQQQAAMKPRPSIGGL